MGAEEGFTSLLLHMMMIWLPAGESSFILNTSFVPETLTVAGLESSRFKVVVAVAVDVVAVQVAAPFVPKIADPAIIVIRLSSASAIPCVKVSVIVPDVDDNVQSLRTRDISDRTGFGSVHTFNRVLGVTSSM